MKSFVLLIALMVNTVLIFGQDTGFFTIVYNNIPSENNLKADWGYSAWIETAEDVVLFDTGTKPQILKDNLSKLNLDLSKVTAVAISHEHYDHTGGLRTVLKEMKSGTKVYLPNSFDSKLEEDYKDLDFVVNNKYRKINNGIWLSKIFKNHENGILEQALLIEKEDDIIVITGCAHPGIVEMCESVSKEFPDKKLELVTGGFHLMQARKSKVEQISLNIKGLGFRKVAPSHCTGESSIAQFKDDWKDNFVPLNLGDTYRF